MSVKAVSVRYQKLVNLQSETFADWPEPGEHVH